MHWSRSLASLTLTPESVFFHSFVLTLTYVFISILIPLSFRSKILILQFPALPTISRFWFFNSFEQQSQKTGVIIYIFGWFWLQSQLKISEYVCIGGGEEEECRIRIRQYWIGGHQEVPRRRRFRWRCSTTTSCPPHSPPFLPFSESPTKLKPSAPGLPISVCMDIYIVTCHY